MRKSRIMRILYLEDDPDSRQLIVVLLGQLGYEVVSAATLVEGLRLARTQHFELIILDNWLEIRLFVVPVQNRGECSSHQSSMYCEK